MHTHPPPQNPAIEHLQEKIELENKIKDGAMKLLQASSSSAQSMEASKGMFVSNAKILAHLREIQHLHTESAVTTSGDTACLSKLAISGLSYCTPAHTHTHTHTHTHMHTQTSEFLWSGRSLRAHRERWTVTPTLECSVCSVLGTK